MRAQMPTLRKSGKAHSSVVGGSTAGLVRKCNGSIIESQYAPAEQWNVYSATGTALHTVVETAIREDLSNAKLLEQFRGVELEAVEMTPALLKSKAIPALEFFDRVVPADASVLLESKVGFPGANGFPKIKGAFGTADVLFAQSAKVKLRRVGGMDWKMGDGHIVEVEDNDQGKFYLSGAISEGLLPVVDEYEFWIFQPSAKLPVEKYATKCIFTYDELVDFAEDLADAVNSKPHYETGPHCAFCKGKLSCKAYKQMVSTVHMTDIKGLNTHQLAAFKDMRKSAMDFFDMVDAACMRNAQAGLPVPGYVLEPALGDRKFKDEDSALNALARLGVAADQRQTKKAISAPKAIELLKEMGTPEKDIERFAKKHIIRPNNGERLVKATKEQDTGGALARLGKALAARGL